MTLGHHEHPVANTCLLGNYTGCANAWGEVTRGSGERLLALPSSNPAARQAARLVRAQEWLAEATRHAAEIDAGVVQTIPAAEVFRAAREELSQLRQRTQS